MEARVRNFFRQEGGRIKHGILRVSKGPFVLIFKFLR